MTILADVEQTEVEVRCPVPKPLPGGDCRPGKLLLKLRLNGEQPSFVHPDNLIELVCADCREFARQLGRPVKRVLHRYDLAGNLCETLTEELGSPAGGGHFMPTKARPRRGPRTVQQAAEDVYADMPAAEVRCRGAHHLFARDTVLPGQAWPDSVQAWPDSQGRIKIQEPCTLCGLVWRITRTGVDQMLDAFTKSYLVYDGDWVSVPQGLDRRKRTIRQHGYERAAKKDARSLQAALSRTERAGALPVQPVRFQYAAGD